MKKAVKKVKAKTPKKADKEVNKISSNLPVIKRCHSFWHRECENRNVECYRCTHFH